jgi:hypothetical protein
LKVNSVLWIEILESLPAVRGVRFVRVHCNMQRRYLYNLPVSNWLKLSVQIDSIDCLWYCFNLCY